MNLDAAGLNGEEFEGVGRVGEAEEIAGMALVELVRTGDVDDGAGRAEAGRGGREEGEMGA